MSLLAPLALLGLAFVPLILAFYMLRLRREERTVSSTYLWQHLVRDVEANAPWQRLRRSLLLLLQLLLVVLLVALVARPVLERPAALARDLVVVVDASASMAARDVFPDRLTAAKQAAMDALRDLPSDGRVSVIAAGESPRVVANEASGAGHASRAIASIQPTTATADLTEALRLADALAARAAGAEILVVTDDAGELGPDARLAAPVRVITIGQDRDNQAIAALAIRSDPSGLKRLLFVSVANYSDQVVPRRLQVLADGTPVSARDLRLAALSRTEVVIDDLPRGSRVIEARITPAEDATGAQVEAPADQLPLDDAAWAIVPDDQLRQVLLVGPGNVYLQNALSYLPNVELYGVTPEQWPTTTGRDAFDLFVFDGFLPDELPNAPILAIAPPRSSDLGQVDATISNPAIGQPSPDEPLLRNVDLSRLHIARAQRIELPDWARSVIPGPTDMPLMYSGDRSGFPTTVIAFDLRQSDLPLQVAWPILVSNITGELLGLDETGLDPIAPSTPVELALQPGVEGFRVTLPDGTVRELIPGAQGAQSVTFVETQQLGAYRVEEVLGEDAGSEGDASAAPNGSPAVNASAPVAAGPEDRPSRFAVDLFSVQESNIAPGDGSRIAALGGESQPGAATAGTARDEWWPLVAAIVLAVLMAEWLLYERDGARRIWNGVRAGLRNLVPAQGAALMPISFTAPEVLVVGALLVALTLLLSRAARHHLSLGRRRLSLVLRTVVLTALVLALAGFRLELPVDRLTTVFVVDLSDSVAAAGQAQGLGFVRDALARRPAGDQAAVVAFGRDALVERLPSELEDIDRIASVPTRTATDIGGALRLASALFPDETQKRIVLISDGNDTTGRGKTEAALASARGVRIETYEIGLGGADEVILQRLQTPSTARVGETIEAEVTISSTVAQAATVRLFADGEQVGSQAVDLTEGLTRVLFEVPATEAGFHTFRAVVETERDTFGQNNRADSDTVVKGDPRILMVSSDPIVSDTLAAALETERQDVTLVVPDAMPRDLSGLASYDSVVLVDVPAERLGTEAMGALQAYVRDVGRGLVMIGGEASYGAGGYARTPIEAALPVDMEVRNRNRQPDIALVVVIDESGSMDACHCNTANRDMGTAIAGVPKVDIGKEAILRAVSALSQRDEFGVVAFNENAHWIINTAPLGSVGDVESQIAGIRANGQTNIFAGLSAAVESLEQTSAERRHIVLLTDGWSSSGSYQDLLRRMAAANITLSAVGAGGGGAADFLGGLAEAGGGRYWSAANPAAIPDIFLKETQQAQGQQIIEEPFFPVQTGDSPILRELADGMPQLLGYNGTTIKPAAQSVLVTGRDDPLLAQWQYGLGRAVAWTSDASGRWGRDWVGWNGFERFFSQLVSWTFPGEETGGMEAEFLTDGDVTRLRLRSTESDGTPRNFYQTTARLTSPQMEPVSVRLEQTAPGTYEATLGTLDAGAYALRIDQTTPGKTPLGRTLVLIAPTSAEYRLLGTNDRLLSAISGATGGSALEGAEAAAQAWTHDVASTTAARDLWPWLLLLALLLWPLDVAVRRVSVGRRDLALARAWTADRWQRWRGPAARTEPVGSMLASKERAGGQRARASLLEPAASAPPAVAPAVRPPSPGAMPPVAASAPPVATPSAAAPPATPPDDTMARLREAKQRARR